MGPATIVQRIKVWRGNRLLVNSVYLMLATATSAVFGFVFWVVVAHGYPATTVGLATTLLALSSLIALLSLAGFDTTLVKFLPQAPERHSDHVNTALLVVALNSLLISGGFVIGFGMSQRSLAFIAEQPIYILSFLFFNCFTALNTLTNAIFLAYRRTWYVLIINICFSALKVSLPFLITGGGAMTIFNLAGTAQLVGFVISLVVMSKSFNYKFSLHLHLDIIRLVRRYSAAVYLASVLNLLPPTILPLLIIHRLGPAAAAYYYMAFTIATMLFTTAYSLMQSAFAEAAHDQVGMRQHIQKAAGLALIFLVPLVVVLVVAGRLILLVFGPDYALNSTNLLRWFSLSAFFVAAYSGLGVIGKLAQQLGALVLMNAIYALTILGLSYWLLGRWGLTGIGVAWLIGNGLAVVGGLIWLGFKFKNSILQWRLSWLGRTQ